MSASESDLLTAKQVAARLRISRRTLYRWAAEGRLPRPLRFGKRVARWRLEDIERLIDAARK